jgi:hypothetical protein
LEWEPNERDAWVSDAQRWINQIKSVLQCKIDLDEQGEIAGIHVVSGPERDPRHIVRDVESLLKARLQMDVYYKKIGVVQVVDNGHAEGRGEAPLRPTTPGPDAVSPRGVTFLPPRREPVAATERSVSARPAPPAVPPADQSPADHFRTDQLRTDQLRTDQLRTDQLRKEQPLSIPLPAILVAEDAFPRLVCLGVSLMSSDRSVRAEVRLGSGDQEATGTTESANHADSDLDCIARATVDAVGRLLALPAVLHLREVRLDTIGGRNTVLVAVDLVESRRTETLLGACAASHNRQQSVVHAVLAALNRRLGLFALREGAAEG